MKGISEENFKRDFAPLSGFHDFHVRAKRISLSNDDLHLLGITTNPHSCDEMEKLTWNDVGLNSIEYSSSQRSKNVQHLMWAFRCLEAHKTNIKEGTKNGIPCYRIEGYSKNNRFHKRLPTLRGYVERDKWKPYIEQVMNLILKQENHETEKS